MRQKFMVMSLLAGLALALCLAGTAPVQAQAASTGWVCQTTDYSVTPVYPTNLCTGQVITINNGSASICARLSVDGAGGARLELRAQAHGTGTDAAGDSYILVITTAIIANIGSLTSAQEATIPITINLIGQGSAPDLICHAIAHVVTDSSGNIKLIFADLSPGCSCLTTTSPP